MKHLKFLFIALMAICFSATANAQKTKAKTKTAQQTDSVYLCPMKCEGEKTYAKAGDCPVCGMHLKAVAKPVSYQCPMKCEGDKTYTAAGKCPVCNMNLKAQPVKKEKTKSKEKAPTHKHS